MLLLQPTEKSTCTLRTHWFKYAIYEIQQFEIYLFHPGGNWAREVILALRKPTATKFTKLQSVKSKRL